MPNGWRFGSSCTLVAIAPAGGSVTLPRYRDVALTLAFGRSDASAPVRFAFADATGNRDVDGKLNGRIAFPFYRSVPCLSQARRRTPCRGRALLYWLAVNTTATAVRFGASPAIAVAAARTLAARPACRVRTLIWTAGRAPAAGWIAHGAAARALFGRVEFPAAAIPQTYAGNGSVSVFALICRRAPASSA